MIKNQPSPRSAVAHHVVDVNACTGDLPPENEVRLLRRWLELVAAAAQVVAHGTAGGALGTHVEVLDLLMEVEFIFCLRVDHGRALLDSLIEWEASLLHIEKELPAQDCLVCLRARQLPLMLPDRWREALRHPNLPDVNTNGGAVVVELGGGR